MNGVKFRVWNKPLGQYINKMYNKAYYLNFEGILCTFNDYGLMLKLDMKNYILEQYTGLKDVNGVEIYEGDKYTFDDNDYDGFDEYYNGLPVGYILKNKYGYELSHKFKSGARGVSSGADIHIEKRAKEHYEVIGNIHEEDKNE